MYNLNKTSILKILHELDNTLTTPQEIILCGSGAILLQDLEFRQTMDIDFTITPPAQITKGVNTLVSKNSITPVTFDYLSTGMVQLLNDYDERLITIDDGFKFLHVKVLSVFDWAVSKLDSPKTQDILNNDFITLDILDAIPDHMNKYCGLNSDKALSELKIYRKWFIEKSKQPPI